MTIREQCHEIIDSFTEGQLANIAALLNTAKTLVDESVGDLGVLPEYPPDSSKQPADEKPDTWAELDKIVSGMDEKPRLEDFPRCQLGRGLAAFEGV